jgi:DNA-binding transcriptional MerR regulator
MGQPATAIPEKIFFKIGEVCDLVGVQAHVLRYWETEFPMLSPQKNRSGQRTYRRRDVEIALRIKELLYDELFTIAGAKKKLHAEIRDTSRLKIVPPADNRHSFIEPDLLVEDSKPPEATGEEFDLDSLDSIESYEETAEPVTLSPERRDALESLASQLLELREMLKHNPSD